MVDGSNASVFPQYNLAQAGLYPDPSQWSNPYSSFNAPGQMPGWPTGYAGAPVNAATGQPIAGYQPPAQGTTLNSAPSAPSSPISPYNIAPGNPAIDAGNMAAGLQSMNSLIPTGNGTYQAGPGTAPGFWNRGNSQQGAPSVTPASSGSNYQSALSALANPGNPVTPGSSFNAATQTGGGAGGQGVLNNFLQNWKQGGIGQTASPGLGGGSSGVNIAPNNPFFAMMGGKR